MVERQLFPPPAVGGTATVGGGTATAGAGGGTPTVGGGTATVGGGTPFLPVPAEFNHWCHIVVSDIGYLVQCVYYSALYFFVFLPARRYASAGYRDRNVSVRLFVTRRYCVKTKKVSGMISSPSGSPKTLVF